MFLLPLMLLTLLASVYGRDAIKHFLKHKRVRNFTIEILNSSDNATFDWVQYKYFFDSSENSERNLTTLRVGVLINDNENFDCSLENETNQLGGYSIDVLENLREALNISVDYNILENVYNLSNLLGGKIDVAICHPYVSNVPFNVTELYPTLKCSHLLIYKPTKLNITKDIFILTFAGGLWLVFFALLILLAVCLRISTTKYSMIPPEHESWTWVEITLWAIAAACQQGLSHTPSGFASCAIFFLGYLTAYLLYTGFAAAITSILVQHDASSNFDLKKIRSDKLQLVTLENSRFFTRSFKEKFVRTKYVDDLDGFFESLNAKDRIGVGPGILIDQYMAKNYNYNQAASYLTSKLDVKYIKGFLIQRNNPWIKILNKQILAMEESGILKNALARNLRPTQIPDVNSGYSSAGREHVGSAILVFLGGVLASVVFLLAEFVLRFYQRGRNHLGL